MAGLNETREMEADMEVAPPQQDTTLPHVGQVEWATEGIHRTRLSQDSLIEYVLDQDWKRIIRFVRNSNWETFKEILHAMDGKSIQHAFRVTKDIIKRMELQLDVPSQREFDLAYPLAIGDWQTIYFVLYALTSSHLRVGNIGIRLFIGWSGRMTEYQNSAYKCLCNVTLDTLVLNNFIRYALRHCNLDTMVRYHPEPVGRQPRYEQTFLDVVPLIGGKAGEVLTYEKYGLTYYPEYKSFVISVFNALAYKHDTPRRHGYGAEELAVEDARLESNSCKDPTMQLNEWEQAGLLRVEYKTWRISPTECPPQFKTVCKVKLLKSLSHTPVLKSESAASDKKTSKKGAAAIMVDKLEKMECLQSKVTEKGEPTPDKKTGDPPVEAFAKEKVDTRVDDSENLGKQTEEQSTQLVPTMDNVSAAPCHLARVCMKDLLKLWQRFDTFVWDATQVQLFKLYSKDMSPRLLTPTPIPAEAVDLSVTYQNTYLSYLALMHRTWSGNLRLRVEVVCTAFHQGQIAVVFYPSDTPEPETREELFQLEPNVISIGENNIHEFDVPRLTEVVYRTTQSNPDGVPSANGVNVEPCCTMGIFVVNPLNHSTSVTTQVDINVEVCAAENFKFHQPSGVRTDLEVETATGEWLPMVTTRLEEEEPDPEIEEARLESLTGGRGEPTPDMIDDPTSSVIDETAVQTHKFKRVLVRTVEFTTSDNPGTRQNISLLNYFDKEALIQNDYAKNFHFLCTGWKVDVVVNGLFTNTGKVVVCAIPKSSLPGQQFSNTFTCVRSLPHCFMTLAGATTGSFEVPFYHYAPVIRSNVGVSEIGYLQVILYSRLRVATGAPTKVSVNVYLTPIHTSLTGRRVKERPPEEPDPEDARLESKKDFNEDVNKDEATQEITKGIETHKKATNPMWWGDKESTLEELQRRDYQVVRIITSTTEDSKAGRLLFRIPALPLGQLQFLHLLGAYWKGTLGFKIIASVGTARAVQMYIRYRTHQEIAAKTTTGVNPVITLVSENEVEDNNFLGAAPTAVWQPGQKSHEKFFVPQYTAHPLLETRYDPESTVSSVQSLGELVVGSQAISDFGDKVFLRIMQSVGKDYGVYQPVPPPLVRLRPAETVGYMKERVPVEDARLESGRGEPRKPYNPKIIDTVGMNNQARAFADMLNRTEELQEAYNHPRGLPAFTFGSQDFRSKHPGLEVEVRLWRADYDKIKAGWAEWDTNRAVLNIFMEEKPLRAVALSGEFEIFRRYLARQLTIDQVKALNPSYGLTQLRNQLSQQPAAGKATSKRPPPGPKRRDTSQERKGNQPRRKERPPTSVEFVELIGSDTEDEEEETFKDAQPNVEPGIEVLEEGIPVEEEMPEDAPPEERPVYMRSVFSWLISHVKNLASKGMEGVSAVFNFLKEAPRRTFEKMKSGLKKLIRKSMRSIFEVDEMIEGLKSLIKAVFYGVYAMRKTYLFFQGTTGLADLMMDFMMVFEGYTEGIMDLVKRFTGNTDSERTEAGGDAISVVTNCVGVAGTIMLGVLGMNATPSIMGDLKRALVMNGVRDALDGMKNGFRIMWNWIVNGTDKQLIRSATQQLNDVEPRVLDLMENFYDHLREGRFNSGQIFTDESCAAKHCLTQCKTMTANIRGPLEITGARPSWRKWTEEVDKIWTQFTKGKVMQQSRMEPVGIYLYGNPGQGKSYIMEHLIPELVLPRTGHIQKRADAKMHKYSIPNSGDQVYFDGYWGQSYAYYDDWLSNVQGADVGMMINFISSNNAPVNMAALEDKGKMFVSEFVCVSTNCNNLNVVDTTHRNSKALPRRFPCAYQVEAADAYKTPKGTLDLNKVNGELANVTSQAQELELYNRVFIIKLMDLENQTSRQKSFSYMITHIVNEYKRRQKIGVANLAARMSLEFEQVEELEVMNVSVVTPAALRAYAGPIREVVTAAGEAAGFQGEMRAHPMTVEAYRTGSKLGNILGMDTNHHSLRVIFVLGDKLGVQLEPDYIIAHVQAVMVNEAPHVTMPPADKLTKAVRKWMTMHDMEGIPPPIMGEEDLEGETTMTRLTDMIKRYYLGERIHFENWLSTEREVSDVEECIAYSREHIKWVWMTPKRLIEYLTQQEEASPREQERIMDCIWLRANGIHFRQREEHFLTHQWTIYDLVSPPRGTSLFGMGYQCQYRETGDDVVDMYNKALYWKYGTTAVTIACWQGLKVWAFTKPKIRMATDIIKQAIKYTVIFGFFVTISILIGALIELIITLFIGRLEGYSSTARSRVRKPKVPVVNAKLEVGVEQMNARLVNNVVGVYRDDPLGPTFMSHAVMIDDVHMVTNNHLARELDLEKGLYMLGQKEKHDWKEKENLSYNRTKFMYHVPDSDLLFIRLAAPIQGHRFLKNVFFTQEEVERKVHDQCKIGKYVPSIFMDEDPENCRSICIDQIVKNKALMVNVWSGRQSRGTEAGHCGLPIVVEGKVLGVHMASIPFQKKGHIAPILAEHWEEALENFNARDMVEHLPIEVPERLEADGTAPKGWNAPGMECHGKREVDGEKVRVNLPMKTDKVLSTIADVENWPDGHAPSVKSYSILYEQAQKYQDRSIPQPPNVEDVAEFQNYMCHLIDAFPERRQEPLEEEQVLNGDETFNMSPLRLETSAGYWSTFSKGKTYFFTRQEEREGERYVIRRSEGFRDKKHPWTKKSLEETLEERRELAHEGTYPADSYWTTQLKDELRPWEKVKEGKTRVFECPPVDYTLQARRLLGGYAAWFRNHAGEAFHHTIGKEFEAIAPIVEEYLFGEGRDEGIAIDYSKYDSTIPPAAFQAFKDHVMYYFKDQPEEVKKEILALVTELQNTTQVCGDYVVSTNKGNKSGNPLTDVYNTFVNLWIIFMVFAEEWRRIYQRRLEWPELHKNTSFLTYGDDAILTVSDELKPYLDLEKMTQTIKNLGFLVTSADKTSAGLKWQPKSEMTFLKRSFLGTSRTGLVNVPLPKEILYRELNWTKRQVKNDPFVKAAVVQDVLRKAAFHGRTFFEQLRKQLRNKINQDEDLQLAGCKLETWKEVVAHWWDRQHQASEQCEIMTRHPMDYKEHDWDEFDEVAIDNVWG